MMRISELKLRSFIREIIEKSRKSASAEGKIMTDAWAPISWETMLPAALREDEMDEPELEEDAPPGWEDTVKKMKKNPEIDNPWALAWSMKKKGHKPNRK